MKSKVLIVSVLTLLGLTAAGAALASGNGEQSPAAETQILLSAKIGLDQAGRTALAALPGTLTDVGFNNENGQGVWEATVIDAQGQARTMKVDAMSGQILGQGPSSTQNEEGDGEHGESADGDSQGVMNQ